MASQQQQAAEVLTPHTPDVSPSFALQLLDLPPTTTSAADNAAVVTSVVDRLVEVVSFRAAAEQHTGLVEVSERKQRVLWETDYKAHEWQQRVAQQQRFRSGQSRFNLTRHISMPANNKTCSGSDESGSYEQSSTYHMQHVLSSDNASPPIAADPGNTVYVGQGTAESAQQHLSASCIRVPCSNSEASASCLLPEVPSLSGLVSKSLLKTNSSSKSSCSSPCQPSYVRSSSTGTNRTAKRRVSDVGGRGMKAYQPMMSLAAKARAAAQVASALSKSAGNAEQQQVVAAARVKAGNMERSAGLNPIHGRSTAACSAGQPTVPGSSTLKDSGKLALVKCPASPRMPGPFRSATFSSSSPALQHSILLNAAVSPRAWQPCKDSKREFYAQPSPGMVLANGAPSALHKKVLELMRRQSDTIKWEQKHNRGTVIS